MGILDRFRTVRDLSALTVSAGTEIEVGRPPTPPPGNIAPMLTNAMGLTSYGLNGWWYPGMRMPRNLAMSVPAVRRGVRVMAGAIASMPLRRYREGDPVPYPSPFLAQPEANRAYVTTVTLTVQDLIFYPYAWWAVTARDWTGRAARVVRLDPEYVTVQTDYASGTVEQEYVIYQGKRYEAANLIRFDGPDAGFLELAAGEIATAIRLEMAAQFYANPESPTGYVKNTGEYELSPDEVASLMAPFWSPATAAGHTRFLNRNADYVQLSPAPEALQLVEAREESARQLTRALGLPGRYTGTTDGDTMTYSTVVAERRDLLDLYLAPYMEPISERLSMNDMNGTPIGTTVRFDADEITSQTPRERAETDEIRIRSGVVTINEVRAEQGLAPLPESAQPAPAPQETADAA